MLSLLEFTTHLQNLKKCVIVIKLSHWKAEIANYRWLLQSQVAPDVHIGEGQLQKLGAN